MVCCAVFFLLYPNCCLRQTFFAWAKRNLLWLPSVFGEFVPADSMALLFWHVMILLGKDPSIILFKLPQCHLTWRSRRTNVPACQICVRLWLNAEFSALQIMRFVIIEDMEHTSILLNTIIWVNHLSYTWLHNLAHHFQAGIGNKRKMSLSIIHLNMRKRKF